ncbi:hypothetical protein CEUSTIGMA_g536.t1 [Chlamydomonas eustigma]|uniref:Major facilitator superfamily (MFS) profile domain-containing protein n=1 Tax=Chlamydomonas eustigma TaxID=1157962 RepID=A0A250WQI7_9CHLO|nr:hypothetical protein CEUSTIGMA_g536.t1 [Chlamydomonas eustigma]|eukprot:GAX73083.1 hypothetical protein CEUSTIGMA_g536.t1 [Chlamydomonas eustigma]
MYNYRSASNKMAGEDNYDKSELAPPPRKPKFTGPFWIVHWYLEWALPGLGMFSEAYIVFSAGQIKVFQQTMWPTCYLSPYADCDSEYILHLANYIQICGIIAGMLFWGVLLADYTGRKWGSRFVAAIMLSGVILLVFTGWATWAYGHFIYFMTAQTWYGFGVGGEYPMASSSAAERSATTPELRHLGLSKSSWSSLIRNCLAVMYGFGAFAALVMVWYRFTYLEESKMFVEEKGIQAFLETSSTRVTGMKKHVRSFIFYFWRQFVASGAWVANDFAFYGNKLQQNVFLNVLFPGSTPYKQQQWNVLNSFIALTGYYAAAALCDKPWYGRVRCQWIGFLAMFVFYIIIYAQWNNMAIPANPAKGIVGSPVAGAKAIQALYYLSSFFNQFGPNATAWLVAGEIFPTEVRASYHGLAAAMGKVGAIIASLWISYVSDTRKVFLISAIWVIGGAVVTFIWLPDTTGLDLEEYDRMQRCLLEGRFQDYHGEAINPRHLSLWEIYVQGWHKNYNPELDREQFEAEINQFALTNKEGTEQMKRMSLVTPDIAQIVDKASHMNA